ncbi:hypothetical protein A2397_04220 [Candidatus Amesbacteria bacterium RIFOXYB1_FULL_44_23]|uniref:Alpha/beta hydrolase n=1 Tax=Candidatus Amesbacteria bacterium RIFOXYB1_FULL_44_23 TaxID=1797263 RepID=A0A1F4ZTW9_9BACT|nr:MAG: hypothetical protein A2397_04220 [Candidatus Amesbacteria bacterium RIFOXYB1_FULL_44_23]
MQTVVLPGYSPKNEIWAQAVVDNLKVDGSATLHKWAHWSDGEFDIKNEVSRIQKEIVDQKINIIAKSVGTQVFMSLLPLVKATLHKVILCGIPIDPVTYLQGLRSFNSSNLLIIQNSQDPFMPYGPVAVYLKLVNKDIPVIQKTSSTHDYPYYDDFNKFLSS